MRKLSVCLLTAATAMAAAGAVPVTALAATGTYNIPGGKMIVIGGSMNGSNCEVPGFPGVNIPGINIPVSYTHLVVVFATLFGTLAPLGFPFAKVDGNAFRVALTLSLIHI